MGQVFDQLIQLCEQTFASEVSKPWELNRLLAFIRQLDVDNLELRQRCEGMNRGGGWDFENLYEGKNLYIKLLIIPEGSQIPLHDHPQMSGIIKLIWGSMHITCYDWVQEAPFSGLARKIQDTAVDGGNEPNILLPQWKNLHTMRALEDCAFVDIFSPHYYDDENRKCTYYEVQQQVQKDQETLYLLKPTN